MFLAGGLARGGLNNPDNAKAWGVGATFFIFLYTATFGATWLTVPWLYPAEIFPLQIRAKGNAWGVVGWSIGNGWTVSLNTVQSKQLLACADSPPRQTLLLPTIFHKLNEKTLYLFGAVNAGAIVMVWALYPESNQRTLEEMNLVFAADTIWNWEAEKNYAILKEENPDLVQAARRGTQVVDPETGLPTSRRTSAANGRKASLAVRRLSSAGDVNDEKRGDVKHL